MALSVVILTKNSSKTIERSLKSVTFADEVLIVDDESSDDTVELAKKHGVRVVSRKLKDFSDQRNFALENVVHEWALFLDSDEEVSRELRDEITRSVEQDQIDGFLIHRIDIFLGKELHYGDVKDVWLLRLGRKGKGKWRGKVHERWEMKGAIGKLGSPIVHNAHSSISMMLGKFNYYSTLRARELLEMKKTANFFSILFYPTGKFLKLYIFQQGFRDGVYGFIHAAMMSFYSYLVRGKLYLLHEKQ